jgi:hypothetical protein
VGSPPIGSWRRGSTRPSTSHRLKPDRRPFGRRWSSGKDEAGHVRMVLACFGGRLLSQRRRPAPARPPTSICVGRR